MLNIREMEGMETNNTFQQEKKTYTKKVQLPMNIIFLLMEGYNKYCL